MDRWDDIVTDRSLSGDRVLGFVQGLTDPERLDGRYLVATSGTIGLKGAFTYSRDEWVWVLASSVRRADGATLPPICVPHAEAERSRAYFG